MPLIPTPPSEEVDTRPKTSPYADSTVTLRSKDGNKYIIPSPLLRKCPKLVFLSQWSQEVLLEICGDVAHPLVHFLFTDTYQCLKPKGSSSHDELTAEFRTGLRVYVLARELEAPPLEELAKIEIQRLGNKLSFPSVVDQVRKAYPDVRADDGWFTGYLKSRLDRTLRNPAEFVACGSSNNGRQTLSVSEVLFQSLIELVHDHDILLQDLNSASGLGALKNDTHDMVAPERTIEPVPETDMTGKSADGSWVPFGTGPKPVPELEKEEDSWGTIISSTKRCKRCKKKCKHRNALEPEPAEPEPEPEPAEPEPEPKPAEPEPEPKPEPVPEPEKEVDFWGTTMSMSSSTKRCLRCKKKKCKHRKVLEPEPAEAPPAATDDWSLCESDSKEPGLGNTCGRQRQHIFCGGWTECDTCQEFVRQLSRQLVI